MRVETRTDYVGDYVAYIFSDGHVETDPPGRPLYKEDVQRVRRRQRAADRASRSAAAEAVRRAIPVPTLRREAASLVGTADLLENFRHTEKATATLLATLVAPAAQLANVAAIASAGGTLPDEPVVEGALR